MDTLLLKKESVHLPRFLLHGVQHMGPPENRDRLAFEDIVRQARKAELQLPKLTCRSVKRKI